MMTTAIHLTLVLGILAGACADRPRTGEQILDTPRTGERILREVHERYTGKRFTHVTFLQRTVAPDGSHELWYEAIRPPGLVRVDIAPLEARNGFMYRADSMYGFRAGDVVDAKGDERWISMLLLVDIYDQPVERTMDRLAELGVDLSSTHDAVWKGRPSVVLGAAAGDTVAAQAWYDAEHLYPVRIIQPAGGGHPRVEFRIGGHVFLEGGWIETEIEIVVGGRVVSRECYGDVRPNAELPDGLYDPARFGEERWAEALYPQEPAPPACPA